MSNKRERLARIILERIEYGKLTPEETERRLNRIIDRELSGPLDRPMNTDLIDLCSALILKLHGVKADRNKAEIMSADITRRLKRQEKSVSRRRILRPVLVAAALIIALVGSLGLIRFRWFKGYSTEDQEQYIIEGHEIKTGKSAEADLSRVERVSNSIHTDSQEEMIRFAGYDPHFPEILPNNYIPAQYNVTVMKKRIGFSCYYSDGTGDPDSEQINMVINLYENISKAPSFEEYGKGTVLELNGIPVYRRRVLDYDSWIWRKGDGAYSIGASEKIGLTDEFIEEIIKGQESILLKFPPVSAFYQSQAVKETPAADNPAGIAPPKKEIIPGQQEIADDTIKAIIEEHLEEGYFETDSLDDLESHVGISTGTSVLNSGWKLRNATAVFCEDYLTLYVRYLAKSDNTKKTAYSITWFTNIADAFYQAEQSKAGSMKNIGGTNVYFSINIDRPFCTWTIGNAIHHISLSSTTSEVSEAELERITEAIIMNQPLAASETPLPAKETAQVVIESDPPAPTFGTDEHIYDDVPEEDEIYQITEETIRKAMEEQNNTGLPNGRRVTQAMVRAAIDRYANEPIEENLQDDNLAELSNYVGFSVEHLDLSAIGWSVKRVEATVLDGILILIRYEKPHEPAQFVNFSMRCYADMDEIYMTFEQDREGTYKKINGVSVYMLTNCGRNGYVWTDGLTIYSLHSEQSTEVLDKIATQIISAMYAD